MSEPGPLESRLSRIAELPDALGAALRSAQREAVAAAVASERQRIVRMVEAAFAEREALLGEREHALAAGERRTGRGYASEQAYELVQLRAACRDLEARVSEAEEALAAERRRRELTERMLEHPALVQEQERIIVDLRDRIAALEHELSLRSVERTGAAADVVDAPPAAMARAEAAAARERLVEAQRSHDLQVERLRALLEESETRAEGLSLELSLAREMPEHHALVVELLDRLERQAEQLGARGPARGRFVDTSP